MFLVFTLILSLSCCVLSHATRMSLAMKLNLVGSSAPLGYFDPLGLSKVDDARLARYRESELKHGRVAMLAVLGWLTQEKFHPLYNGKLSGNPLKAFGEVPPLGFVQIVAFCGLLEYTFQTTAKTSGSKPGDYFGISQQLKNSDTGSWEDFQTRELNNGRLAMFAILGEITHSFITGKGALEQIGL